MRSVPSQHIRARFKALQFLQSAHDLPASSVPFSMNASDQISADVTLERAEAMSVLTLNAPERINAISLEMREALIDALNACIADTACKVIVITGAGGNFSSGGDIRNTRPSPDAVEDRVRHSVGRLHEMVRVICNSPKPVIAAVEGKAYGAGMSLAAACDVVVSARDARFCAAFGRVGLVADAGLMHTLPRRVGHARAKHMLLTARLVEAGEAAKLGLVDVLADSGQALVTALEEGQRMLNMAPLALAATKALMGGKYLSLEETFEAELRTQPTLAMTQDYAEGRAAFAEKRRAVFLGR